MFSPGSPTFNLPELDDNAIEELELDAQPIEKPELDHQPVEELELDAQSIEPLFGGIPGPIVTQLSGFEASLDILDNAKDESAPLVAAEVEEDGQEELPTSYEIESSKELNTTEVLEQEYVSPPPAKSSFLEIDTKIKKELTALCSTRLCVLIGKELDSREEVQSKFKAALKTYSDSYRLGVALKQGVLRNVNKYVTSRFKLLFTLYNSEKLLSVLFEAIDNYKALYRKHEVVVNGSRNVIPITPHSQLGLNSQSERRLLKDCGDAIRTQLRFTSCSKNEVNQIKKNLITSIRNGKIPPILYKFYNTYDQKAVTETLINYIASYKVSTRLKKRSVESELPTKNKKRKNKHSDQSSTNALMQNTEVTNKEKSELKQTSYARHSLLTEATVISSSSSSSLKNLGLFSSHLNPSDTEEDEVEQTSDSSSCELNAGEFELLARLFPSFETVQKESANSTGMEVMASELKSVTTMPPSPKKDELVPQPNPTVDSEDQEPYEYDSQQDDSSEQQYLISLRKQVPLEQVASIPHPPSYLAFLNLFSKDKNTLSNQDLEQRQGVIPPPSIQS